MYPEIGNDEQTEMQLEFQDSRHPSAVVTTPGVGSSSLNVTAANHAVNIQKFRVLNEQQQAFAEVVRFGQNRVPLTWVQHTGPGG